MKTIALALAATTLASAPATAGVYLNAEANDGYNGAAFNVSQSLGIYGEVSTITNGDEDRSYGTKLGAKYKF